MPIQAPGKPNLTEEIRSALLGARNAGTANNANSDEIINSLANNLTNAIDRYVTSIVVTINPGQLVQVDPVSGAGSTTTPASS